MIGTSVSRHHQKLYKSFRLSTDEAPDYSAAADYHGWQYVDCNKGRVDPLLLLVTLSGGTLAAAAAQNNCIYDRDIDYEMERTRHRPLPSGRVQPRDALLFAILTLSFTMLAVGANLLSALLAMSGIVVYMLVYTHWLKRHSTQNIVIGGAAGAIPPLVGCVYWDFKLGSVGNFAIVFVDSAALLGFGTDDS